jgi:hypothetical protein
LKAVSSLVEAQFWPNEAVAWSPFTKPIYLQRTCGAYMVHFCQVYNAVVFAASNQELTVKRNIYKSEEILQERMGFHEQQPYSV